MAAHFRLIDRGWVTEIEAALAERPRNIRIACPFIKRTTIERMLRVNTGARVEVVTRFDLKGFFEGVSDIEALRLVIEAGGEVRGLKGLHSKLMLFGSSRAIAGSANLTEAGLRRNHEFGFVTTDQTITTQCGDYFHKLWQAGNKGAALSDLQAWSAEVDAARRTFSRSGPNLPDYGVSAPNLAEQSPFVENEVEAPDGAQFFVKFFGSGNERAPLSDTVSSHVESGGCHWACTYGKRPRNVQDGAVMYMARVTRNPNDIRIFGQAIGRRHRDGIDDASEADIASRGWKRRWPYYVRVHDPRFVKSTLADGISLTELMGKFGQNSFLSTQRNSLSGRGNTNPRRSLSQQPQIQLTPSAAAWVEEQLSQAYRAHGTIDLSAPQFDRPANV